MKIIVLVVAYLCISCLGFSQANKINDASTKAIAKASTFPTTFLGHWKGELQWMRAGKPSQSFTMQLIIQPADTLGQYTWQIIYGDSAKDNRPYILKPIDTAMGHWVIDETDGILLHSYVFGNSIKGAFTIMNNTIIDSYTVENNTMKVEFFTINLNKKNTSGKGTDEVPLVDSYEVKSVQVGVLVKVK